MNYQKHYDILITRAQNRIIDGYQEIHHIVPRCIGGNDDATNLVSLTPEEHFVAHQLLIKLNPGIDKLVFAVTVMSGKKNNRACKQNKLYGWLKRKLSETRKGKPGKKQSQETITKRANSNRGKKRTAETKERMSAAQKGKTKGKHTEETKMKISNSTKLTYKNGKIPGMLGKHHTEESKIALSKKSKGKRKSLVTRKGQKNSVEHRRKISESKKGKKRNNFIPWNKGKKLTEDEKKILCKNDGSKLKDRTWEDIYGVDGAAKRRESQRLRNLKNKETLLDIDHFKAPQDERI